MPDGRDILLERFVVDAREALGTSLRAVLLYGDAVTSGSAAPADLTTAVVVDAVTTALLERVARIARAWKRRGFPAPLLLDSEQLATSCDVFPLELLALQHAHRTLWGEDPLSALVVDGEHLRLEVEEQLKGKLLHLRQAYLDVAETPMELRSLLLDSSRGFEMILRGLVHIAGGHAGGDAESLLRAAEETAGIPMATFRRVRSASADGGRNLGDVQATFRQYHDELAALARAADRFSLR